MDFYREKKEELFVRFKTSENGLSDAQSKENRDEFGKNELVEGKKKSVPGIFFDQYKDFLVIMPL